MIPPNRKVRRVPRASVASWTSTAIPRPVVVATAAPVTPSAGKGPRPKMRHGSSTRLIAFASQRTRIATAASPAPRKTALMRKRRTITTLPPSITAVNFQPDDTTSGLAPIRTRSRGARSAPMTPRGTAIETPERDRLHGRARGAVPVPLADPPRHGRGRGDREADRERVEEREHRFRQADRRDGAGAELRHPEHVHDREDRLERHLEDHRDREEDDRAPDRTFGEVAVRAAHGFTKSREDRLGTAHEEARPPGEARTGRPWSADPSPA